MAEPGSDDPRAALTAALAAWVPSCSGELLADLLVTEIVRHTTCPAAIITTPFGAVAAGALAGVEPRALRLEGPRPWPDSAEAALCAGSATRVPSRDWRPGAWAQIALAGSADICLFPLRAGLPWPSVIAVLAAPGALIKPESPPWAAFAAAADHLLGRLGPAAAVAALAETEKLAALGRLAAGVAHELGSPLQSIISLAELMERGGDRATRPDSAAAILRSALRCRDIAQQLLGFARRSPTSARVVDVREVLLDSLELDRFSPPGDVEIKIDPLGAPLFVRCDPNRLAQVVLNLLANARHAVASTGRRGVIAVRAERTVAQTGATGQRTVVIAVDDSGPGVPADLAESIFDAFVTTKAEGSGTGLGLYISRQIVEEAGGRLYLASKPGPGARFVIELPESDPPEAIATEPSPAGRRLTVLVVDDDHELLDTYRVILESAGHLIVTRDRARSALEACRSERFDVVVCDVRLPDLSADEFLSELHRLRPEATRHVVFATGDVTSDSARRLLERVELPPLVKPFRIEELERAIREAADR